MEVIYFEDDEDEEFLTPDFPPPTQNFLPPPGAESNRTYGIEFEMVLSYNNETAEDSMFCAVTDAISDCGIEAIGPQNRNWESIYMSEITKPASAWFVGSDASVAPERRDFLYCAERVANPYLKFFDWIGYWHGTEIVSAVLNEQQWEEVWNTLNVISGPPASVLYNTSTSTHVHIGIEVPGAPPLSHWDLIDAIKRLSGIWYLFEGYLIRLFPEYRVGEYTKRVRRTPLARACRNQAEWIDAMYNATTRERIVQLTNNTFIVKRGRDGERIQTSRHFTMNTTNITGGEGKFTIEFRQHEGTKDFEGIQNWTRILMRFFDLSVRFSWNDILNLTDKFDAMCDQAIYGDEKNRTPPQWLEWAAEMHTHFAYTLLGERLIRKYTPQGTQPNPEQIIATIMQLEELNGEELEEVANGNIQLEEDREEELAVQRMIAWMRARELKFRNGHNRRAARWAAWDSEIERRAMSSDYKDYPNPSGRVYDQNGRLIQPYWRIPK
ncbi:putative amidoligase enzyme-domain-containing protein [Kalaharituber pfeilii]|nr:putative amidoligase enzyme-domain-containing protein [Kalaharituber pfeilii]